MTIPDTLAERIALFSEAAHAYQAGEDLFRADPSVQVMLGQRLRPRHDRTLAAMPGHQQFLDAHIAG